MAGKLIGHPYAEAVQSRDLVRHRRPGAGGPGDLKSYFKNALSDRFSRAS
jgi:hypothetical protein